jgi:hypothetical protein
MWGPFVLTDGGKIAEEQPGSRSPFWPAFAAWHAEHGGPPVRLGLRQMPDGTWMDGDREAFHLGGRHWVVVGPDRELPTVKGKPVPLCPGCKHCRRLRLVRGGRR